MQVTNNSKMISILGIVALCSLTQIINTIPGVNITQFGIYPRNPNYLLGIIFSPFIHVGWMHLINNILSFSILSWLVCQYGTKRFWIVFIGTAIGGGLLVWILGRSAMHVGLSGVIYGLWGYLIAYGFVLRSFKSVLISVVVLFLYSYFVWGMFPSDQRVSFEGHFFGALVGLFLGYFLAKSDKKA